MDSNFNPIKDLQPSDPFNLPAGESIKSVESIRLRLVETRNRTAGIVDILKKRNNDFSKDIKTIRELNRRLMRTIPRIPILRGDASIQGGSLEEISARRGEFDFDFNTTTVPPDLSDLTKPTANIRGRLINFAVDVILFFFGGRLLKGFFPGGLKNPKNIKRLNDLLKMDDLVDDTVKVRPGKKINPNPIKKDPLEVTKVFAKNNIKKITNQIRSEASRVSNSLARGDKNSIVLENADKAILNLNTRKFKIIENFGKITNPNKTQIANQNQLIQEIDKALNKVNSIRNLPQLKATPLSKDGLPKTLQELIAESEDFGLFNYKPRPKKRFSNTQLDRETNIFYSGEKFYNDLQQYIKSNPSALDKNLLKKLQMKTGRFKDIFIVD